MHAHSHPHRNNRCLCGPLPGWLAPYALPYINGSLLTRSCAESFTVAGCDVADSNLNYPGDSVATGASLYVTAAPAASIGADAVATLLLFDGAGNPTLSATGASMVINGTRSGVINVPAGSWVLVGAGKFQHTTRLTAAEQLVFTASVLGTQLPAVSLAVRGMAPQAVDWQASVAAAELQVAGATARTPLLGSTPLSVIAHAVHALYLPVISTASGARVVADPLLSATASATLIDAATGTALGGPIALPPATWSWTNGSYVLPLSLPSSGTYLLSLTLEHATGSIAHVGGAELLGTSIRLDHACPGSLQHCTLAASVTPYFINLWLPACALASCVQFKDRC